MWCILYKKPINALTQIKKSSMKNFLAASLGQFDNTKLSYLKSKNTGDCFLYVYMQ